MGQCCSDEQPQIIDHQYRSQQPKYQQQKDADSFDYVERYSQNNNNNNQNSAYPSSNWGQYQNDGCADCVDCFGDSCCANPSGTGGGDCCGGGDNTGGCCDGGGGGGCCDGGGGGDCGGGGGCDCGGGGCDCNC